jgi:hypothetical protein
VSRHRAIDGERYEELRAQATGDNSSPLTPGGLALFLHSGMAAWMRAWSSSTPLSPSRGRDGLAEQRATATGPRSEVVAVVAGMVLSALKGGTGS